MHTSAWPSSTSTGSTSGPRRSCTGLPLEARRRRRPAPRPGGRRRRSPGRPGRPGTGPGRRRCGRGPGPPPAGRGRSRGRAAQGRWASRWPRSSGGSSPGSWVPPAGCARKKATPTRAESAPTIQKRSVIFSSGQPTSSKWWWSGAIRNSRRPCHLNHRIWAMSWTVSRTNTRPMTGSSMTWPVMSAMTASVAPSARAPESPMKTSAGWTLNQRKPSRAPMMSAHRMARLGWAKGVLRAAMAMKPMKAKTSVPPARPSRPSVMLTRCWRPRWRTRANRMYSAGLDADRAEERHDERVDVVGVLDLPRHDERHDRLPDQLLAGADAVAGARVEPVVGRAQRSHQRERGEGREGRPDR